MKIHRHGLGSSVAMAAVAAAAALMCLGVPTAHAANIIQEWGSVKVPPPPPLKSVTVDPDTTALLMLDFLPSTCNTKGNPRCIDRLPAVKKLLDEARSKNMLVVYTAYGKFTAKSILPEIAPKSGEPFVVSFLNKYNGTDLHKILKAKGIQTVIAVGVVANGAVLVTAGASAEQGFNVIVPVDGMASPSLYAEQYTAWHLTHAPVIDRKITLTTIDMIKF